MRNNLLIALSGALIGTIYLSYIYYSEFGAMPDLGAFVLATVVGITNAFLLNKENKRLDSVLAWKDREASRLTLGVVANYITALLITFVIVFPVVFFADPELFGQMASRMMDITVKLAVVLLMGVFIYNVVYFANHAYNQYAVTQIESLQQQRRQLKLQFEALKSQLSPHYLFNSLNTVSSLVYKDAHLAENFIRRLAQTYSYILGTNNARYVLLKEEIEFVRSYNYLLQVRFENSIHLNIEVSDDLMESKIPPLTLQMLVENAVKHNQITSSAPITIEVKSTRNNRLEVVNNKTTSTQESRSFEIGLSNIQKRYSLLCKEKVMIDDGDKFKVTLPIITALNLQTV